MSLIWITAHKDGEQHEHANEHAAIQAADNANRGRNDTIAVAYAIEWPPHTPRWSKTEDAA